MGGEGTPRRAIHPGDGEPRAERRVPAVEGQLPSHSRRPGLGADGDVADGEAQGVRGVQRMGARDAEAPPRSRRRSSSGGEAHPKPVGQLVRRLVRSRLAATGRGGGGGASLAREHPQVRAVRVPHVAADAEPRVHAVGDGTVAHEGSASRASELRRQDVSSRTLRRVQLVVVDHHRATTPARVGEARGGEAHARRRRVVVW